MDFNSILEELYDQIVHEGLGVSQWEESFINDLYETVIEEEDEMTESQEDKVEEIYLRYIG